MTTKTHWLALSMLLVACAPEPDAAPPPEPGADAQRGPDARAVSPKPGAERAPARPVRVSHYSSLGDCRVVDSRPDEGAYSSSLCPGAGGYSLRLIDADARQNLFVRSPDGAETSLALSEAAGGGFSHIGERVEWRGASGEGSFAPDALVVRYFVVEAEAEEEVAYLLPVTLRQGGPCVTARIEPGPEQSARARETVDGEMHCLQPRF